MKIQILDGHNVIGGNKILITANDGSSILLDFGKNFSSYSNYFEEFLTPRATAGIYDYWKLDLLPHLNGLYRSSLVQLIQNEVEKSDHVDLQALFLTHAHLDHAGYIPFIDENIPVVTSPITYSILQSIQDVSNNTLTEDYCTASVRELKPTDNGEVRLAKQRGQDIPRKFCFDEQGTFSSFRFYRVPVDHSILGASAFYIEVDNVRIAYTGDLRFHGTRGSLSKQFFEFIKQKGVDILICEGTRVPRAEDMDSAMNEQQLTENDIKTASLDVVRDYEGRLVIADFGARNVERLKVFLDVAKETNRRLAITFKDAHLLELLKDNVDPATGEKLNYLDDPNITIIESKREKSYKWKRSLSEQYGHSIVTLKDISKDPGSYIVCYSYFDMPNLLDLDVRDKSAYVYSTSEAYSEEQLIDTRRLFNWLKQLNFEPFGIAMDADGTITFTRNYHVSGHSSFKDLVNEISLVNPSILFPVHSEHIETYQQYFLGTSMNVCLNTEINVT